MEGPFKRTLCKFYLEGTCTKGELCTWSHADEDGRRGGPPPQVPPQQKKSICKFWLEGTCKSGDNCTWAHGEHELGMPLPGMQAIVSRAKGDDLPHKNGGGKGVFSRLAYGPAAIPLHPIGFAGSQKGGFQKGAPSSVPAKRSICKFWLEGKCREGDRCTWAHGEEDLGHAEPLHPWSKPMAFTPPIGARPQQAHQTPAVKRTLCKFWMEGTCQKGDRCTWAHGDEDVGNENAIVDEGVLEDEELEEYLGEGLSEEDVAGIMEPMLSETEQRAMGPGVTKTKRTICKFWLEGRCRDGENCTYAHGEEELGTVVVMEEPVFMDEPRFREERGFAGAVGATATKRTQCKFWLEGRCQAGDRCTWAHGEEDVGVAVPVEAVIDRPPPWKGGGKQSPIGAGAWKGGGKGTPIGAGPPAAHDPPGWMGPNAKRTICKFWQQGRCQEGANCTYAHGEYEMQSGGMQSGGGCSSSGGKGVKGGFLFPTLSPLAPTRTLRMQPEENVHRPGIKRSLCKFWLDNACTKGDECTFAHGEEEVGQPIPGDFPGGRPPSMHGALPPSSTPCRFFAMGTCTKGDSCAFAHVEASDDEPQVKRQRLR